MLEGGGNQQGMLEGSEGHAGQHNARTAQHGSLGQTLDFREGSHAGGLVRQDSVRLMDCESGDVLDAHNLLPGAACQLISPRRCRWTLRSMLHAALVCQ